jgi:hypothetical protein
MKKVILIFTTFTLAFLSLNTFAQKLTITGQPVTIERSGDYYVLPANTTYTATSDYYYVDVSGTKRVCYREVQPALASANLVNLSLRVGTDTVAVNCYTYTPDYFITQ